jgi:hypothetical protein
MSAVEVVPLAGADLASSPPCDMFTRRGRCGRRSAYRVKVICPEHGTALRFLCRRHLLYLKLGLAACRSCGRADGVTPVSFGGYS